MLWTQKTLKRWYLVALALSLCCGLMAACSSAAFTTRAETSDSTDGDDRRVERSTESSAEQAVLPDGPIDPVAAWETGDAAYRAGDMRTAQQEFGLVYVADPNFRGGQIRSALLETCRALGNDCGLVMARLDLLILDYADLVGPREQWVPQQEADYAAILSCYDEGLKGNYEAAYYAGHGALNAPLLQFAQHARVCVDRVETLRAQAGVLEQRRQAQASWDTAFSQFAVAYAQLEPAIEAEDWDAIVDAYPAYKLAEEPVAEIIDGGMLADDPSRADDVEQAANWLAWVREWEADSGDNYEVMRDAIRALDEDSSYNQFLIEYQEVHNRIAPLEDEIATLEIAAEATSGDEHQTIQRRIDVKESEIREIRRELRRIMGSINSIRRDAGLPPRDMPYGIE